MNFRKIVFTAAAVVACMGFTANAGVHPNGIGLRFGGGSIYGAELNYQLGIGASNRLEIGFGWSSNSYWDWYDWYDRNGGYHRDRFWTRDNGFGAFGAYQWHWNISPSAARGGFNWYAGPGAGIGLWFRTVDGSRYADFVYDDRYHGRNWGGIDVNIGGQIGIEYDFNVLGAPIVLDIDSRPTINIPSGNFGFDLALGVRYTF